MNTTKINISYFIFLILLFGCNNISEIKANIQIKEGNVSNDTLQKVNVIKVDSTKRKYQIDTVSVKAFLEEFISNIRNNKINLIKKSISFPIYAHDFAVFKYGYNCNQENFNIDNEKYKAIVVNKSNFNNHFNYLFVNEFFEILNEIDINELIINGTQNKVLEGVTISIHSYKYNKTGKWCGDHTLNIFIFRKSMGQWKVGFRGN